MCGGSACAKNRFNFLIKSLQTAPVDAWEAVLHREATSMRQASEWRMRALQSSYPRLKDCMIYDETGERRVIMKRMVLLFNLRSRWVRINQVLNTDMPSLERDAKEELVALSQRADHIY